jgi:hypothetical protein
LKVPSLSQLNLRACSNPSCKELLSTKTDSNRFSKSRLSDFYGVFLLQLVVMSQLALLRVVLCYGLIQYKGFTKNRFKEKGGL